MWACSSICFLKANNKCDFPHLQFGLLTDVTELNLGNNEMTGSIPTEIGCMPKVVTGGSAGFMGSNALTGSVPTELGALVQMTSYVGLHGNKLSSTLPTGEHMGVIMKV